jgi:putative ABC transport system permease protein
MVLREGLVVTMCGLAVGVCGAWALTRFMQGMLYGVGPLDGPSFAGAAFLAIVVSTVAAYVPALRATKVDPLVALRCD